MTRCTNINMVSGRAEQRRSKLRKPPRGVRTDEERAWASPVRAAGTREPSAGRAETQVCGVHVPRRQQGGTAEPVLQCPGDILPPHPHLQKLMHLKEFSRFPNVLSFKDRKDNET